MKINLDKKEVVTVLRLLNDELSKAERNLQGGVFLSPKYAQHKEWYDYIQGIKDKILRSMDEEEAKATIKRVLREGDIRLMNQILDAYISKHLLEVTKEEENILRNSFLKENLNEKEEELFERFREAIKRGVKNEKD